MRQVGVVAAGILVPEAILRGAYISHVCISQGMCLMDLYLIAVHLIGIYLTGMHLIGVCLMRASHGP